MRRPSGDITFDPDEQVQQIVRLIFRKFEDIGTLNGVLRYFVQQDLQVGVRVRIGVNRGDLEWRRLNRMTLQNLLKNPMYTGAYAYGKRQIDARKKQAGRPSTGRVVAGPDEWHALIRDCLPAYISWEQYEHNLAQLQANQARADTIGAVRPGAALLCGLLTCAYCSCRMTVHYCGKGKTHEYVCARFRSDYGGPVCQHIAGRTLDTAVTQLILAALQPATLELSLQAAACLEQERAQLNTVWQQRLERAQLEAERAARHYRLVEPENRLVARQLARDWEAKLTQQQELQENYDRFCATQPRQLSVAERAAIVQLAQDVPALWNGATTSNAQRKDIIRHLIHRITVQAQGQSEVVTLTIEWTGGSLTTHTLARPVARLEYLTYYPELCERLRELRAEGIDPEIIAEYLNQAGFQTPRRQRPFTRQSVLELMRRLGLYLRQPKGHEKEPLALHEWWLPDLARHLNMPDSTLYHWIEQQWVQAYQQEVAPKRWVIWADEAEVERLKQWRQEPISDRIRQRWLDEESPFVQQGER